jgi:hypothetical protein
MAKASAQIVLNAKRIRTVEDVAACIPIALRMVLREDALFINFLAEINNSW